MINRSGGGSFTLDVPTEDRSILIIAFTLDYVTVVPIRKVHLASIKHIYLRLSVAEMSA